MSVQAVHIKCLYIKAVAIKQKVHDVYDQVALIIFPRLCAVVYNDDLFERIIDMVERCLFLFHLLLIGD